MEINSENFYDALIYETKFWFWCIEQGFHNEDWVLDNLDELHKLFEEDLE